MRLFIVPAMLLFGVAAQAQWGPYGPGPYGRNDPYGPNDPYGRNDPYNQHGGYYGRGSSPEVQRAISDLERARGGWFNSERGHIDRAISELSAFQDKWYGRGRFDTGHLDRAIDNMKKVTNSNRVNPRYRDMSYIDINALRSFRESGGRYGNGYPGGYGGGRRYDDGYRPW